MNTNKKGNESPLATAGLVLGISALVTSFFPMVDLMSIPVGILAAIFGIVCLVGNVSKGKAIVSLVCGILAVVIALSVLFIVFYAIEGGIEAGSHDLGEGLSGVLDKYLSTLDLSDLPTEETAGAFTE